MLIDFQQHYTPPELLKGDAGKVTVDLDRDGNPHYLLNPLLADLDAHVRMMDAAGIDAGVLSCGLGFDQPDLAICRTINDRMREAEKAHPGRFIGLAHVPALQGRREAAAELKRCAVELGFPGVVIASELQDQPLDAEALRAVLESLRRSQSLCVHPSAAARHPLEPHGCRRSRPHARLGVLADDGGGAADQFAACSMSCRRCGFSSRISPAASAAISAASAAFSSAASGALPPCRATAGSRASRSITISITGCIYDIAGWAGPDHAAEWGADWVQLRLDELAFSQLVFASTIRKPCASRARSRPMSRRCARSAANGRALAAGVNAEKLIPDIGRRLAARRKTSAKVRA